jgi:murein DD-endopeptidase MepM/ murein hydrolase activator NlpD
MVFFLSILFGYSLVFGQAGNYSGPVRLEHSSWNNIYSDNINLNRTKLLFRSGVDLSEVQITSSCDTHTKFISKRWNIYILELKYFTSCDENEFLLLNHEWKKIYSGKMNIISEVDLWNKFIDYSSDDIEKIQKSITGILLKLHQVKNKSNALENDKQQRVIKELQLNQSFLQDIQKKRMKKYIVPVAWYSIATKLSKIPNAGRPYRQSYTDGIHHGWDVWSKLWEPVRALDHAVVVRVVSGFTDSDFAKIDHSSNLTYDQRVKNLDVLRWNQVWIKTAKGDVVFYSHLNDIYSHIEEWMLVKRWELLGTIWKTGVPWKNYTDYHLHFAVQKNPYNKHMVGKYDFEDYMKWDWYFRGQSSSEILKYQDEVFE